MERRLIKIAKELNVGTQTIVDHLNHNGFDVENKPTAKITDEMYSVLLKEFQKSLNDKEKERIVGSMVHCIHHMDIDVAGCNGFDLNIEERLL